MQYVGQTDVAIGEKKKSISNHDVQRLSEIFDRAGGKLTQKESTVRIPMNKTFDGRVVLLMKRIKTQLGVVRHHSGLHG